MTDPDHYRDMLLGHLRAHSPQALDQLRAIAQALPPQTRALQIGVHPNAEPDGAFTVIVHLDGPDLFALNRSVQQWRTLFEVLTVPSGFAPAVPMFDPFDQPFPVNDVIVDTVIIWLRALWSEGWRVADTLRVTVFDAAGDRTPPEVILQPGA